MGRITTCRATALLVAITSVFTDRTLAQESLAPNTLLVYYAWPSAINGSATVDQAAAALGAYDYVILGDGLQIDTHPDYANTVAILAHPAMADTKVFGYVDLGVTTQNLPETEYKLRMVWWTDIGADGIFLDDFGYDFGVSRQRQNDAVEFAHALEVPVIVNAWDPDHAFSRVADATYNPNEIRAALEAGDFYFAESFVIREGQYEDPAFWREKADKIARYQASFGVEVLSVTTPGVAYDEAQFHYAWFAALIDGHTATGWGEPSFASADAAAPFRSRPAVDPGTTFLADPVVALPLVRRETDAGAVELNVDAHTYRFIPNTVEAAEDENGVPRRPALEQTAPNPVSGLTEFAFLLPVAAEVRLTVFDLLGRFVAVPAYGFYTPGTHRVSFDASVLPAGVYAYRLEAGGHGATRRFVVVR